MVYVESRIISSINEINCELMRDQSYIEVWLIIDLRNRQYHLWSYAQRSINSDYWYADYFSRLIPDTDSPCFDMIASDKKMLTFISNGNFARIFQTVYNNNNICEF